MSQALYPEVHANPDFAALEESVLDFWRETNAFQRSIDNRPARHADGSSNSFVFYDGPPFANGLPHYGHLLTGYVKDAIARYQTMLGKRVERRFGWDCHGLPAEMATEKELGISGRAQIMNYGIGKFNAYCQSSVMKYTQDWNYYVTRQGRWVDFENDYKTMDKDFMESVLWAFSELYKKGLVYESFRVMPYSWAAETPVSNFETRIDNATREREDKAATVAFTLNDKPQGLDLAENAAILAWTTTPWTLPSNLALAVSSALRYVAITKENKSYVLAAFAAKTYAKELLAGDVLETPRTIMRPFTEADGALVQQLHRNEQVAATTYDGMQTEEEVAAHHADFLKHQKEHGFSQWAVFERATGKFMGRCGITKRVMDPSRPPQMEVRAAFLPEYWRAGFGRECLRAWLARGFFLHGAELMVAAAQPGNERSHTMLKSIGYSYEKDVPVRGATGPYFTCTKESFLEANSVGGDGLAGLTYEPLFPYFTKAENAFRILDGGENVTEGDGTGVVHMAPGFGEVDYQLCKDAGIGFIASETVDGHRSFIVPVDGQGLYTDEIFDLPDLKLQGFNVIADKRLEESDKANHIAEKDVEKFGLANMRIVRWLKAHGALIKDESYKHNYPHCWRTDTPLIYRAMSSWYVNVQAIKDTMAANNKTIHWIPDHVQQGQMGKGIESAPDWSISRNRFWGTPIPIWRSDNPNSKEPLKVFGSIAELEAFFGTKVEDLHRPFIDDLVKADGEGYQYTRVEDVFDCWFESGSMPYAQLHYPFENKAQFEENFPADFITEYIAQTRGWFYTLQVLSAALFGCAPFKNVICHGVVIDEETGLKYSKRLKNYKDPKEVMNAYGADALRWMMLSSPVMRGADLAVDPDGKFIRDVVRLNIKPLWSAYNFFTLYANADGVKAETIATSDNMLDRYILAKCKGAVEQVRTSLDAYDTPGATEAITSLFDVLNNWYIRRSRARFWGEEVTADKKAAFDTLFTVLNAMCQAAAPLLPFTTEMVYRGLNGEAESVHLQDFPDVSAIAADAELVADMDRVRDACTAMSAIRNAENIRNRQPLASATLYGAGADRLKPFADLMEDEINVKEVRFANTLEGMAEFSLTINFPVAGKRLGGKMKEVAGNAKAGKWTNTNGQITVGNEAMEEGEYTLQLKPLVTKGAQRLSSNDALVVLDLTLTPELEAEGRARDLVRMIQQARKDAGLNVGDRITLHVDVPADFQAALSSHAPYIQDQTLAVSLQEGSAPATQKITQELDGAQFVIGISKAA